MKRLGFWGWSVALAMVAAGVACSSNGDSCSDGIGCAGTAGSDASGGSGGAGGAAGSGGTGGAAGSGGAGGSGGASGSASSGGASGSAGTSGTGGSGGAAGADAGDDGGDGSTDAGSEEAAADQWVCPVDGSPAMEPCVIRDELGVFVSKNGGGLGADGTRSKPFATIAEGVAQARSKAARVYVCADAGTYDEQLVLADVDTGLRVYGGFRCADWTWSPVLRASVVSPTAAGHRVANATVSLESLSLDSADATTPGSSAYGITLTNATLRLVTSEVRAGKGADGVGGTDGADGENADPSTSAQDGLPADCTVAPLLNAGGGWPAASACGSRGGTGAPAVLNGAGAEGTSGTPTVDVTPTGADNGGTAGAPAGVAGGDGEVGSRGDDGEPGAAAAAGQFTSAGYAPADGMAGTPGHSGQGGGGGGSSTGTTTCVGASGGGGGLGGCGGHRGTEGRGGGASVAIFAWDSALDLVATTVGVRAGGKGGRGGNAGHGGTGGIPGRGGLGIGSVKAAGDGGYGGDGGHGGPGSGGTGGSSHALVRHNTTLTQTGSTLTVGTAGAAGAGGKINTTAISAPNGAAGDTTADLVVP